MPPADLPPDFEVTSPFTRAAGLAAGLTDRDLRGPAYRRLLRGTYVSRAVEPGPAQWVRSAMLLVPTESFASHQSAATLLGGTVPATSTVHLGTTHRLASTHAGIRLHRYAAAPAMIRRGGIPCTDGARTFLDLAAVLDLVDLVVLGDSLLAAGALGVDELQAAAQAGTGHGVRRARQAARLVRARVESPMETRVRLLLVLAGLPEPEVNLSVRITGSGRRYRLDLAWPRARVAVEYDGRHHIDRSPQWQADLLRREELEGDRWRLIVLTAADLHVTPHATVHRVADALRLAGMPLGPLRTGWERHFVHRRPLAS